MKTWAVVLAAGAGERLGSEEPKAFVRLGDRSLIRIAAEVARGATDGVVVTVDPMWVDRGVEELRGIDPVVVRAGGATRKASVRAALEHVPSDAQVIVCHDAARPFASSGLFRAVIAGLVDAEGAVPVLSVADTVKRVSDGLVERTLERSELVLAQTPQAFIASALRDAHERVEAAGIDVTDDSAALEWAGYRVRVVPGEPANFKITFAADLARARALAAAV
jgi:2-C-methyl-D-erythritol 4-phosphate cytidylyltransferase